MRQWHILLFIPLFLYLFFQGCSREQEKDQVRLRMPVDTVGFVHTAAGLDSVISYIDRNFGKGRREIFRLHRISKDFSWPMVICPHDDYIYAGDIYPYVLENVKAAHVIIFGVAHKARKFNLENQIIFDSFTHWKGPYGNIPVSGLREEIMALLPPEIYQVHDSLQQVEHSVEALVPFLQHYNRTVQIVSILVPYMSFDTMKKIARQLAQAIGQVVRKNQMQWGRDFAIAISNDCVHYGDQGWGGKNYAQFGADSVGYRAATRHDLNIISECLIDFLDPQKIHRFITYTVQSTNYKEYRWAWCGRYSVPFGLLTGYYLQNVLKTKSLNGILLRYSTSLEHPPMPLQKFGLGVTAPANIHHWVGYAAIGYRF